MFDAISLVDTNTLQLKLHTSKETSNAYRILSDMQVQENRAGDEGFSTDFKISISDTSILIEAESINLVLIIAKRHQILSPERSSVLGRELRELIRREEDLQDREKLSQQIANRKGIFAAHSLGKKTPQRPKKKGLPDDLKKLIEIQDAQPPLISLIGTK